MCHAERNGRDSRSQETISSIAWSALWRPTVRMRGPAGRNASCIAPCPGRRRSCIEPSQISWSGRLYRSPRRFAGLTPIGCVPAASSDPYTSNGRRIPRILGIACRAAAGTRATRSAPNGAIWVLRSRRSATLRSLAATSGSESSLIELPRRLSTRRGSEGLTLDPERRDAERRAAGRPRATPARPGGEGECGVSRRAGHEDFTGGGALPDRHGTDPTADQCLAARAASQLGAAAVDAWMAYIALGGGSDVATAQRGR